jgi:Associated with zinc fingers
MKRKKRNNNNWDQASKKVNNNNTPPSSPRSMNQNIDNETTESESPFITTNPFNVLTSDQIVEEAVIEKPPPILIKNITDYISMCQLIRSHIGPKFSTRTRYDDAGKSNVQLQTETSDDFRKIIKVLDEKKADYHCYQLKEDKPYRVAIRFLHPTTSVEAIKTELSEKGFQVRNVHNAHHPATKLPLPLFFVELERNPLNQEIFKLETLVYTRIRVEEPYKRNQIPQCHRCQEIGHTKTYCRHQPRCVKCGKEHLTVECDKPRLSPPKCALCQGEHPANYRGCQVHKELQRRLGRKEEQARTTRRATPSFNLNNFPNLPQQQPPQQQQPQQQQPQQQPQLNSAQVPLQDSYSSRLVRSQAMPTFIPPPPRNEYSHPTSLPDINSVLSTFLVEIKNTLTPLIDLLTKVMTALIPALIPK